MQQIKKINSPFDINNINQTCIGFLSSGIFFITLILAFVTSYPSHKYYGIELNISYIKLIEFLSYHALITYLFIYNKRHSFILFNFIFYCFVIAPIYCYYATADQPRIFMSAILIGHVMIVLFTIYLPSAIFPRINRQQSSFITFMMILSVIALTFIFFVTLRGLPDLSLLDISTVYEYRSGLESSFLLEYLRSMLVYAVAPLLIPLFFFYRRYFFLLLTLAMIMVTFLYTGSRIIFMLVFFMIVFTILMQLKRPITLGFLGLSALFGTVTFLNGTDFYFISHFIFFRPIETPAWLTFVYYEIFSSRENYYLIENFDSSVYPAPQLVGDILFPYDPNSWANVGFIGHAYYNFGIQGIILFSIILGLILAFSKSIADKNIIFFMPFLMILAVNLASVNLLTILINRGYLFGFILLFLLSSAIKRNNEKIS